MIHALANVLNAEIGAGTKVWQFASVIRGAKVGDDCSIASCAIVDGSVVGNRCIVGHGASISPGAKIGSDVFIGPGAIFCNDAWPRVEKGGFEIEKLVGGEFVTIIVEDFASIGAGAVILPGVIIGRGAIIAAGAVVTRSVPPSHILGRDGALLAIDPVKTGRRMREAKV